VRLSAFQREAKPVPPEKPLALSFKKLRVRRGTDKKGRGRRRQQELSRIIGGLGRSVKPAKGDFARKRQPHSASPSTNSAAKARDCQALAVVSAAVFSWLPIKQFDSSQRVGAAGGLGAALGAACGSGAEGGCCGGAGMPDFVLYASITALVISMLGTEYRTSGGCC